MTQPRIAVGDFELTILSDGTYFLDAGSMFGVVPKSLWSRRVQPDERNLMACGLNSVLVRTGEKTVLIETGIGNKLSDKLKAIYEPHEQLMKSLEAVKVAPEEIDVVINSHLHFDHCGWNTVYDKDGKAKPTFPNAKYYAQRGEWEHGQKQLERDRISYIGDNYDPLVESGQMQLLEGNTQILPGISVELYPGHTRNMQAIMIESAGKKACYISDLIPTSHHLDLTWVMSYDVFPLDTIESRKRFYSQAVPQQWLTIFTHDHERPWAYLDEAKPGKVVAREVTT
jgi:glyoxylase-like metal-dependent hydrolase (beta-lactamase superfamily II)